MKKMIICTALILGAVIAWDNYKDTLAAILGFASLVVAGNNKEKRDETESN